jgi:hypothetical protein
MLNIRTLSVVMLNVIMLRAVMLSVVMQNVVALAFKLRSQLKEDFDEA